MKNKILINKLKDNAELAMAAYGYFHLVGKKFHKKKQNATKRHHHSNRHPRHDLQ